MNIYPMPRIRRVHYENHLGYLSAACDWMRIDRGRAARYRKLVMEFFACGQRSREHILAFNESCEIIDIYELWEPYINDFPHLGQKIKAVYSKGPILREDERPETSSNRPRNDAFVYVLAGKLARAGVKVISVDGIVAQGIDCEIDADITFGWDGTAIAIQCKRPQTQHAVEKRAREAREQLTRPSRKGAKELSRSIAPSSFGLRGNCLKQTLRRTPEDFLPSP